MIGRPRVSPLAPIVASLLFGVSCGQVQTAGTDQPVTIRLSTGFVSGNFRPFSEALAEGYGQLMPDVRIQQVNTTGSLDNIQGLEDGVIDIGLSQAGIAYMAYNGQLGQSARPMRGIRGIAILNSSPVHLLVGPRSRSGRSTIWTAAGWASAHRQRRVGDLARSSSATYSCQVTCTNGSQRGPERQRCCSTTRLDAAFTCRACRTKNAPPHDRRRARVIPIHGPRWIGCGRRIRFFRGDIIPVAGTTNSTTRPDPLGRCRAARARGPQCCRSCGALPTDFSACCRSSTPSCRS